MKILVLLLMTFNVGCSFAQYTEKQVRDASRQVIDEEIKYGNLSGEYEKILREYLNKWMLNQKTISHVTKVMNKGNYKNKNEAFEIGLNSGSMEREKSMKFLSNKDLNELMKANLDILNKMNDFECSQYIKKKNTEENGKGRTIYGIAGTLEILKFKNYIGLYSKAFDNMTYDKNESQPLSDADIIKVKIEYRKLGIDLIEDNKKISDFIKSGKTFNDISEGEVCQIGKSFLGLVIKGELNSAGMRANAYINGILN
jgi:hypothetical protein